MTASATPDLRIGRVLKAHGVQGAVVIESLTDFPDRFQPGMRLQVAGRPMTVAASKMQGNNLLVAFTEVKDREAAGTLVGAYCTVPLSEARGLPEDRYYHFQLVGLSVFDRRQQRTVGKVAEVLTYAANDVLRVRDGDREALIPMVKSVVTAIDPAAGTITVELPEEIEA